MKILLILPAADHLRITGQDTIVPKRTMLRFSLLSLTTVAGLTPPGHEIRICDENVESLDVNVDVDLVGISFMTACAPRAYAIAGEFRRRGITVVAGGYHPTLMPDEVAEHFDAVVVGDAEEIWPRVVEDCEKETLQRIYRHTAPPSLADTPLPRRDLLARTARFYATTDAVQVGRGCIHSCKYCSVAAFHQGAYRNRPLNHVLEELKGIGRDFIFVDDNIVADPEYAIQLFKAMIPLRKRWVSQAPITLADNAELLQLAAEAGCQGLFIGIETTNAENLKDMHKNFNCSRGYAERIRRIKRQGIAIIAGIIVGLDGDDVMVFENTFRFLQNTGIDAMQLNILTPLPGTPLYSELDRTGRIVDRDWSHYNYRNVVLRPKGMEAKDLQDGADWLYQQFYRLDRILIRCLKTLFTVGPLQAWLALRLNLTYRYDNKREGIIGRNPAKRASVKRGQSLLSLSTEKPEF